MRLIEINKETPINVKDIIQSESGKQFKVVGFGKGENEAIDKEILNLIPHPGSPTSQELSFYKEQLIQSAYKKLVIG
jgi:hypothetical protein